MPWHIEQTKSGYCLHNSVTRAKVEGGCYAKLEDAEKHRLELYAASFADEQNLSPQHRLKALLTRACWGFGEFEPSVSTKALEQKLQYILEGKIHKAFTDAADELFIRGYLTRDERIALSGIIGDLLGEFGERVVEMAAAGAVVNAEDVDAVAHKSVLMAFKEMVKIRGNLCRQGGQFVACNGTGAPSKPKTGTTLGAGTKIPPAKAAPKPKGGSGKGKGKGKAAPKKTTPVKETAASKREAEKAKAKADAIETLKDVASPETIKALEDFSGGKQISEDQMAELTRQGLMELGDDGAPRMTTAGRSFNRAVANGDAQQARDVASRARDQISKAQQREADKLKKEEEKKKPKEEKPEEAAGGGSSSGKEEEGEAFESSLSPKDQKTLSDLASAGRFKNPPQDFIDQGLVRPAEDGNGFVVTPKGLTEAGLAPKAKTKSFSIFKDSNGDWRWVSRSSSNFRDKDGHWVSEASLEQAVALAEWADFRGPLRYWHVKGADIGDCDFQMVIDGFLIESGTFYDQQVGLKAFDEQDELGISLGFLFPKDEPLGSTFYNIAIFERSMLPAPKASNNDTVFQVLAA